MQWNRQFLEYGVKDYFGLSRTRSDGLLTDTMVIEAIEEAMYRVAKDCHLWPITTYIAMIGAQWKYAMRDDILNINEVWYIDSNGLRAPMTELTREKFMAYYDPTANRTEGPYYYAYPMLQRPVIKWDAEVPARDVWTAESNVTTLAYRTVIDSGANFGFTSDGTRIVPGCLITNVDDSSEGYVEVLDISTAKETGTADGATTSSLLSEAGKDFPAANVQMGDIICSPNPGVVVKYAFVTSVAIGLLGYEDIQGGTAFENLDTYKVGRSTEIRITQDPPRRGMMYGARNYFYVSDPKATINGTTFTDTTVTGTPTAGSETNDIAMAAGGSHGKISNVATNVLTVDKWIGGNPADGEVVTVRESDTYQVEGKFRNEAVIWLRPTPAASDAVGEERIEINANTRPILPTQDDDPIEIDQQYSEALLQASIHAAARKKGNHTDVDLAGKNALYENEVQKVMGDIWQGTNRQVNPSANRRLPRRSETRFTIP